MSEKDMQGFVKRGMGHHRGRLDVSPNGRMVHRDRSHGGRHSGPQQLQHQDARPLHGMWHGAETTTRCREQRALEVSEKFIEAQENL